MNGSTKKFLLFFLKIGITGALLVILFRKINLAALAGVFSRLSLRIAVAAILIYILSTFLYALKWRILIPEYGYWLLVRGVFISGFYSFVLPGLMAGDIMRVYTMRKDTAEIERIAVSVVFDRFTGFTGLFIVAAAGVFLSHAPLPATTRIVFLGLLLLYFVFIYVSSRNAVYRIVMPLFEPRVQSNRLVAAAAKAFASWHAYSRQYKKIMVNMSLGIFYKLVSAGLFSLIAKDLSIDIAFVDWCWILGAVAIIMVIPLTVAGLGLREYTFIGILAWFGIGRENALAVSLIMFGLQLIIALIGLTVDMQQRFLRPSGSAAG